MLSLLDVYRALSPGHVAWSEETSPTLTDVVVDSRNCSEGGLFVALRGERTDGHLFVEEAFRRGARAAIVDHALPACASTLDVTKPVPAMEPPTGTVCFVVKDTLRALQDLAAFWRRRFPRCRVVGVTGSVGKTTTKELIAAVLGQRYRTLKSPGNFNNEIGAPLTLLKITPDVEWVVQEMAMYDIGEIARLVEMAAPEIGVVTNVGPTHLERLGTIERVAMAKAELVTGLPSHGIAVLNGDDQRVRAMAPSVAAQRTILFGLDTTNDAVARQVHSLGLSGLAAQVSFQGHTEDWVLPLLGKHVIYSVLAATVIGVVQGLTWEQVLVGLRSESVEARTRVLPGFGGTTILDDTYNASPASVEAALELLSQTGGRKVAVLGDMFELGSQETTGHQHVGRVAAGVVDELVTVGSRALMIGQQAIDSGLPSAVVSCVMSREEAVAVLRKRLRRGDCILVKGSRGMAMEAIVQELAESGR